MAQQQANQQNECRGSNSNIALEIILERIDDFREWKNSNWDINDQEAQDKYCEMLEELE